MRARRVGCEYFLCLRHTCARSVAPNGSHAFLTHEARHATCDQGLSHDVSYWSMCLTMHIPFLHRALMSSHVFFLGSTMFSSIAERCHKELTHLAPSSIKVKVVARPERKYSA